MPHLTDLLVQVNQGQEVLMVAVGAMKMGMRADARQTGCHLRHQDTNHADWCHCHVSFPGTPCFSYLIILRADSRLCLG
jgi:hypothetical protein